MTPVTNAAEASRTSEVGERARSSGHDVLSYPYHHVDVFTERALVGNPLAVFTAPGGLSDREMQAIALELNLAETVFVFPPVTEGSVARLRIFTPRRELTFAGHPTVGAVATILGDRPDLGNAFHVDEGVGPVPIRVEQRDGRPPLVWLTTPPVEFGERVDRAQAAKTLGLDVDDVLADATPAYASAGSPFLFVGVRSVDAVDRAAYAGGMPTEACPSAIGVFVFTPNHARPEAEHAVYARMFAPWSGIPEDPATGGATGPLAAYLLREGLLPSQGDLRLISEQGTRMGRRSLLHVRISANAADRVIEIGGCAVPFSRGTLTL